MLAGLVLVSGLCAPAMAATAPGDAAEELRVSISGSITAKCELTRDDGQSQSFGAILDSRTGRAVSAKLDLGFHLKCNAPYKATLISKNGGLAFEGPAATGFADQVGYSASIDLDNRAGSLWLYCDSADMRAAGDLSGRFTSHCRAQSHGHGFSEGDGHVHLTLENSDLPLLEGEYFDELTLRVSPNV